MDDLCCRTDGLEGKLYELKSKTLTDNKEMWQFADMCFDFRSPMNARLKETLIQIIEETTE